MKFVLVNFLVLFLWLDLCLSICELKWVKTDHRNVPAKSVLGNTGNVLGDFYPARATVDGVLTPGRFKPAEEKAFITIDGKEHTFQDNFEVLTNPNNCILEWKAARDGTLIEGAVEGGVDKQGVSKLYKNTMIHLYTYIGFLIRERHMFHVQVIMGVSWLESFTSRQVFATTAGEGLNTTVPLTSCSPLLTRLRTTQ